MSEEQRAAIGMHAERLLATVAGRLGVRLSDGAAEELRGVIFHEMVRAALEVANES